MKKSHKQKAGALSARVRFPEDEKRQPWLAMLLDAYAVADTGVTVAVGQEEKRRREKIACSKGCDVCCHQRDIPLYPHDLVGVYWYASEKILPPARDILKSRLANSAAGASCPFLIDRSCIVHPLRPVSCRQFNVIGPPCAPNEDPYYTRPDDVLVPIAEYTDRAFAGVLPFYAVKKDVDVERAVKLVRSQIMNLRTFDWTKLVTIMKKAEERKRSG